MSNRSKKPSLTAVDLFKNKPGLVVRQMLGMPKVGRTGPELAKTFKMSKPWASRILATLEFEGFAKRDGNKPHGKTCLTEPEKLIQRWRLSYNVDFNESYTYRVIDKDPLKLLGLVAKKSGFAYAVTGKGAQAIRAGKKITEPVQVYLFPKAGQGLNTVIEKLENDFDFIPTHKKPNIVILNAYHPEGAAFGMERVGGIPVVSELQMQLDQS